MARVSSASVTGCSAAIQIQIEWQLTRPLKRAIQQEIENPLAKEILAGRFAPKDIIRVDVEDGRIVCEQVIEAETA